MRRGLTATDEHGAVRRPLDKDEIIERIHSSAYCVDHKLYDEGAGLSTDDCVVDLRPGRASSAQSRRLAQDVRAPKWRFRSDEPPQRERPRHLRE
jgi:hypothetical protein